MKVNFNRAALAEALGLLASIVPARTPEPISLTEVLGWREFVLRALVVRGRFLHGSHSGPPPTSTSESNRDSSVLVHVGMFH